MIQKTLRMKDTHADPLGVPFLKDLMLAYRIWERKIRAAY